MLKIVEISSKEQLNERLLEEDNKYDYLYICKYCNQIKMSDNGVLKTFTGLVICESQEEYNNITDKEDVLYVVKNNNTYNIYFSNSSIGTEYTDEEVNTAIDEILND